MLEIKMKWIVRLVIFLYMCYRAVYGAVPDPGLSVEQIDYGEDGYNKVGTRKTINCKGFHRNQKLEWVDPFGNVVKRVLSNRVFTQEHFVATPKGGRAPGLVLTLNQLRASDSGVYQCRSGNLKKEVPVCVLESATFIDPKTEVTAEVGRAITLSCQAKGDPEPRLVWIAGDTEISDESDVSSSNKYRVNVKYNTQGFESLLTILSLEPSDSKVYTCVSIQETPMMDDCGQIKDINITLNVNHEPFFENGNDTELVYGKESQVVNLVCSASGYPLPTYRWFKDRGDTLLEFEQKQIIYSEVDNQAVLSVTAGPTTFGQKYKCKATNEFGETDKYFMLLKMEKPSSAGDLNFMESSDTEIVFNITYDSNIDLFPIKEFDIQYLKVNPKKSLFIPKEAEWRRANVISKVMEDSEGNIIKLDGLEAVSKYWVRARAVNDAGVAPWSTPMLFNTSEEKEVVEEVDEETNEPVEETMVSEEVSDGTFYGIFFAGGIIIVSVACMFIMRLV